MVLHKPFTKKDNLLYANILRCSPPPNKKTTMADQVLPRRDTAIVDSGATHIYIAPRTPHGPPDTTTPKFCVGTATGHIESLSVTVFLPIPQVAADFSMTVYIIPSFNNTLVGIGPIYDANCTVLFTKQEFTVFSPDGKTILTGWREE